MSHELMPDTSVLTVGVQILLIKCHEITWQTWLSFAKVEVSVLPASSTECNLAGFLRLPHFFL